jgi:SPP1 family predicted phage head-tail adaptor
VYAYVRQLDGEEATLAREIVPRATHQVEIDYDARCKPRARFKFPNESRYLNIESVDNFEERNRHMVCVCVEEVST